MKNKTLHIRPKANLRKSLTNIKSWVFLIMLTILGAIAPQSASAKRIYCKNAQSWWKADGAAVGAYFWGGTSSAPSWPGFRMTAVAGETDLWYYDIPDDHTYIIFTRVNGSGTIADWGAKTGDLKIPTDGKNLYTITSSSAVWGDPGVSGSWSTYTPPCTPATSITSAELQQDGTISLEGNFTTCGAKYHGFQWRKVGSNWCGETGYANNKESNYVTIGNTDVNGSETASFTPEDGGTYEFRTYIVTTSPWLYSTTTIEVSTCIELPDDAYDLSSSRAEWTGRDITPTIRKKDENYPTPTITYNGGSALPNKSGEYTIKATVSGDATYCNKEFNLGTFTITCPSIAAPAITTSAATVCAGTKVTLSSYNGNNTNTVKWYSNSACAEEVTEQITPTNNEVYYAKAYHAASGCYSSEYSTLTFTVNPLPIISISGSEEAVLYEDVMLTATATDGATVKWYEGDVKKGEGLTYVVTSETATSKTITATATSTVGCTSTATKTVTFSEENCADVTTTAEEPVGKIKLLLSKPSWIGSGEKFYCYAWKNNTSNTLLGSWPGTELTQKEGSYYVIIVDSNNTNIKIILNDGSEQTVDSDVLNANKIYQISATSSKNSDNKYTFNSKTDKGTYKESVTTTVPAPITAPAVKITSLTTTPGEGNINFSGQIVKTGCDNSITYGFEYKAEGDAEWTQKVIGTNQDKDAGFDFSDNTVKDLDGTYEVRAFITNDHSTQYSDVKTIELSTSREPVKSATIELTALDGTPIEPGHKYCIGSTAYIKLTTNVNYTSASWKSNQGAEIVPTRTTNIYQFTVKGNDEIVALVSNKYNDTPAESNSVLVDVYPEPISPTVSLSPSVICSNNDGATLSIASVAVGQTYVLYKYADENDNEGAEVDGYDALPCIDAKDELSFTNLTQAGRYFVKTYNTDNCPSIMSASSFATLEVVDASDVFIGFEPTSATTTPWMPAKFTVNASDKYTLTVPEGVVYNIDGNKVSVKIPLPESSTGGDEQYENVTFPQGAKTSYTIIANLATSGGVDNPCAAPAEATITLTPYVEPCTEGH